MSKNIYINNIKKNKHDFALGVDLPLISIQNKNINYKDKFLLGHEYKDVDINCRNLYDKEAQLIGVIKYDLTSIMELNKDGYIKKNIKYGVYLDELFL